LVSFALFAPAAYACSCKDISLDEDINSSAHVFRAYVTSAAITKQGQDRWTKVSITEIIPYKGDPKFAELRTHIPGSMCGMAVRVPDYYWFFVSEDGSFSSCSHTRQVDNPELEKLETWVLKPLMEYRKTHGIPPY
jgi:hypothetical protein